MPSSLLPERDASSMTREAFGGALGAISPGIDEDAADEYFRAFATDEQRLAQLELYRSGEFSELEGYEGRLGALGVPALIIWGGKDEFAPVAGAYRFAQDIQDSAVEVIEEAGHFVADDAPEVFAEHVATFAAGVTGA